MVRYGEALGLAFQKIDDLLDGDGYTKFVKAKEIKQRVRDLIAITKKEIKPFGKKAEKLQVLSDFLLKRIPKAKNVAVDK